MKHPFVQAGLVKVNFNDLISVTAWPAARLTVLGQFCSSSILRLSVHEYRLARGYGQVIVELLGYFTIKDCAFRQGNIHFP